MLCHLKVNAAAVLSQNKTLIGVLLTVCTSFALVFLVLPNYYDSPDATYYSITCCISITLLVITLCFCDISHKFYTQLPLILLAFCAIIDALFMFMFFKLAIIGEDIYQSKAYFYCFNSSYNWDLIYSSIEIAVLIGTIANAFFVGIITRWLNKLRSVIINKYYLHDNKA